MTDTVTASPPERHQREQQDLAKHLAGVRERLDQEFHARLDSATVTREFDRVTAAFSDAKITAYVPVLVNRQVRLSLRELARAS